MSETYEKPPVDPAPNEEPDLKPRADFLPGREPQPEPVPAFGEPQQIVVVEDRAFVGQVVHKAGFLLAEVRLAHGVTLGQLAAAIVSRRAGPEE